MVVKRSHKINKISEQPVKVLLIEDDPISANMLREILSRRDDYLFDVKWADKLQAGLECLAKGKVDVILFALSLSGMHGLEAFTTVYAQAPGIPTVVLSSLDDEAIGFKAIQEGAQDYLVKGQVDGDLLVRTIRHAIECEQAADMLQKIHDELEQQTTALSQANAVLRQEIVERKRIEEELRFSEERFRQVVTSISDHIYVTEITKNGKHINLYLSPNIQDLTGYPQQNFTDWRFWTSKVIHPNDRIKAATQATELAGGQNSEVEYRMIRADGNIIWVRDSARVHSKGGSKIIYGVVSDITERKQAEREIYKLNQELEQRVMDRTRELAALYDVTAVSSQSLDLETILKRLLERSLAAMRSNVGAIHTLDETGNTLRLDVQRGLTPDIVVQVDSVSSGNGLPGWVIEQGESLLVSNLTVDSRAPQAIPELGLQTYIGVPMRTRGKTLGVLSVFGEAQQQFNVEDVALLASIGDQVGVVIENARLRQQAELTAVMKERERLARELHDSVTQSLYSITLLAGGGQRLAMAGKLENVPEYMTDLSEISQQALKEMRLLVHQLRPAALEQEGLVGALQQRLDVVERRSGVATRLLVEDTLELPMLVEEGLYGIAQEALNNAIKHAAADSVTVYIHTNNEQIDLEVIDDGKGFNPDAASHKGGMGLISMQERTEKLGGSFLIFSGPGVGTKVKVSVKTQIS